MPSTTAGLVRQYSFEGDATQVVDATGNSAPAPLGLGASIIPSTSPTETAPEAPTPPSMDAEVTAYVYDMSPEMPLAHDDIVLEYKDDVLARRWMHSSSVDEPVGFEDYTGSDAPSSGSAYEMYADRQGSISKVVDVSTGAI